MLKSGQKFDIYLFSSILINAIVSKERKCLRIFGSKIELRNYAFNVWLEQFSEGLNGVGLFTYS